MFMIRLWLFKMETIRNWRYPSQMKKSFFIWTISPCNKAAMFSYLIQKINKKLCQYGRFIHKNLQISQISFSSLQFIYSEISFVKGLVWTAYFRMTERTEQSERTAINDGHKANSALFVRFKEHSSSHVCSSLSLMTKYISPDALTSFVKSFLYFAVIWKSCKVPNCSNTWFTRQHFLGDSPQVFCTHLF